LPFKDSKFDRVYCYEVLEHVVDEKKSVSELARTLKWGGRIYISVPHPKVDKIIGSYDITYFSPKAHLRVFEPDELKALLEKNNIKINSIKYKGFFQGFILFTAHTKEFNGRNSLEMLLMKLMYDEEIFCTRL